MKTIAKQWVTNLSRYETGKPIEEVARELGFENAEDIIKLASNENALGVSPMAVRVMKKLPAKCTAIRTAAPFTCAKHCRPS